MVRHEPVPADGRLPQVPKTLTALPENAEQHTDAGGDKQRLDRLILNVLLEVLLHLASALAALFVVFLGLLTILLVLLSRGIASLRAEIAKVLSDLSGGVA